MAFQIIRHAFSMIFGNFGQALRVSLGPFLILSLGFVLALLAWDEKLEQMGRFTTGEFAAPSFGAFDLLIAIGLIALFLFVFSWVAVSWHRFILLEEYSGAIPAIASRPIWPYVGRSLLYALVLLAVGLPLMLVIGFFVVPLATSGLVIVGDIMGILGGAVLTFVWLRIALALPSVAVGQPITMGDAWAVSAALAGTIFQLALALVLINSVADFLTGPVYSAGPIVGLVAEMAIQWLVIMLGVSVLTTLYGHLIEKRPLIA